MKVAPRSGFGGRGKGRGVSDGQRRSIRSLSRAPSASASAYPFPFPSKAALQQLHQRDGSRGISKGNSTRLGDYSKAMIPTPKPTRVTRKPLFSGVVATRAKASASEDGKASDEVSAALSNWHALFEGEERDKQQVNRFRFDESSAAMDGLEVRDAFCKSMSFGTAGLRAKEGLGFNRMNEITVALTSQGIADYILQEEASGISSETSAGCVAIGFDGRTGSRAFARSAALSFASKGLKVLIFDEVVPTPLLAYVTRTRGCKCGVMVTASHNPKEYNGYKVYWSNGCQIIPPIDQGIADCIARQTGLATSISEWTDINVAEASLVEVIRANEQAAAYCSRVADSFGISNEEGRSRMNEGVQVVYTPLHGVGSPYVSMMFEKFKLSPFAKVMSQDKPDASFPTVSFPNPEEGAGVWTEAFKVADEKGIDVCLANDPDADRFCCAERVKDKGQEGENWFIFSGNDLGIMLGDWAFKKWQEKKRLEQTKEDGGETSSKRIAMLTTAVSARVLQSMCQQEGIHFEETLTGFKWLGNRALELEAEGYEVLFAYEEAIGFMIGGTGVVDKDGVATAALFVDLLNHVYHSEGSTLQEHLRGLYTKYGRRLYKQGYFIIDATINADEVFESLRKEYPAEIGGLPVKSIRDMGTGLDTSEDSKVTKLPWSKGDKMITFRFHDNGFCTIRASGTEPKLKYYIDLPLKDEGGKTIDITTVEENISKWLS